MCCELCHAHTAVCLLNSVFEHSMHFLHLLLCRIYLSNESHKIENTFSQHTTRQPGTAFSFSNIKNGKKSRVREKSKAEQIALTSNGNGNGNV